VLKVAKWRWTNKPAPRAWSGAEDSKVIRGFTFLSSTHALCFEPGEVTRRGQCCRQFAAEAGLKQRLHTGVSAICGKVEAELAQMSDADAAEFLGSYGLKESAISRLINAITNSSD